MDRGGQRGGGEVWSAEHERESRKKQELEGEWGAVEEVSSGEERSPGGEDSDRGESGEIG